MVVIENLFLKFRKDYPDTEVGILDYRKADFCQKCLSELQSIIDEFVKEDLMK